MFYYSLKNKFHKVSFKDAVMQGVANDGGLFFPNKINVEFVEVINENKIKMRVWERGVGETPACGSGACASVYAGYVKGLNKNNCEVILNNGSLFIDINNDNEIIMNGPAEISFYGKIDI